MASSSSNMPNTDLNSCLVVTDSSPDTYPYPSPLAEYEDVVGNPKLFMNTLQKLHFTMGTKFMIPVIGGKELDLHRLFVEVTFRGGIEKIVKEKKWKEVTAVFNFPTSATNASFVLRKYYISLLHHYEQIYYFKAKNWIPSSDLVHTPHRTPMSARGSGYAGSALPVTPVSVVQPLNINMGNMLGAQGSNNPALSMGTSVTGIIDGKFESGYLVTITIGSQKLKGVLYHTAEGNNAQSSVPESQPVISPYAIDTGVGAVTASGSLRRRRRKKSEIKRRDPAHPKHNRSGYNFFFAEEHARLKILHPLKDREISKMIGELWNSLKDDERSVYQEKAMKDKERYKTEMESYREKIKAGEIVLSSTAALSLPRLGGQDATLVETKVGESLGEFTASSNKNVSGDEDVTLENESDVEASRSVVGVGEGCSGNADTVVDIGEGKKE